MIIPYSYLSGSHTVSTIPVALIHDHGRMDFVRIILPQYNNKLSTFVLYICEKLYASFEPWPNQIISVIADTKL